MKMARTKILFISLLGILGILAGDLQAQVALSNFPYKARLEGMTVKNMLYRATIGTGLFEKCSLACLNSRIFDSSGREIPYVIYSNKEAPSEAFHLEVLSLDEKQGRSVLILKRKDDPDGMVNILEIMTNDHDFHKDVFLEGSDDKKTWHSLGQDSIYDFSSQVVLRRTAVSMNANRYRFLRLTMKERKGKIAQPGLRLHYEGLDLSTSLPRDKKIYIRGFSVTFKNGQEKKAVFDHAEIWPAISQDEKLKNTEIFVETRFPAESLVLDIDNPYYLRNVTVYGSQSKEKRDMVLLCRTSIHNLSIAGRKEIRNYIEFPGGTHYGYYRIVIENHANPPLTIKRISQKWTRKEIFFLALDNDRQYWLYTGNDSMQPVSYDIAAIVTEENKDKQGAGTLTIGPVVSNPEYKTGTDQEKKARIEKIILMIVIGFLVVVAAFFLYCLWKKAGDTGNPI
ncbi:MAG: hypothetical protein H6Q52_1153 [Deltaproteobacteria bacterium]|nr:hypothetical protein [Deltaproteobacteria bacterium]